MPRLTEAEAYQIAGYCLKPLDGMGLVHEQIAYRLQQVADRIVAALLGAQGPPPRED